jgi:YrbI family 3-deoxy-D-manno-octulosonate 8-phosphate phosphatase
MQISGFRQARFRFFGRIGKYLLSPRRALEIDEPSDWPVAEALMVASGRVAWTEQPSPVRLAQIKAVITDFDGVMTDNTVQVDQNGLEAVVCNRGDGWGLDLLRDAGYLLACISTETNEVVSARCEKLRIPYWYGQRDKLSVFKQFLEAHHLSVSDVLYIGNDSNDSPCLEFAGIAVVPADAAPEAIAVADWQTSATGGSGVLREVARALLRAKEEMETR